MSMDKMYQENILEHYRHPQLFGKLPHATSAGSVTNPLCGDEMEVFLKVEKGMVKEASFVGKGCAISTAAASMLLPNLPGKSLANAQKLCSKDVLDLLAIEVGPTRMKCALLVLDCVRKAITQEEEKR